MPARGAVKRACGVVVVAVGMALAGTGLAQEGPGSEELAGYLAMELPPYWTVEEVTIVAEVNDGDAVDPSIRQRFEARARTRQALLARAEGDMPPPFVRVHETLAEGAERMLYGTSRAVRAGGAWRIELSLENHVAGLGQPADLFQGPVVVQGSEREREVVAAAHDDLLEAIFAEIDAELTARDRAAATEIEALEAAHADALAAVQERHAEALARAQNDHAARLEAMRRDFDQRMQLIVQETEHEAELLRAEIEAAISLAALAEEHARSVAALAEARAQAREAETAALAEAMRALAARLADEDASTRQAALATALADEDARLRDHAVAAALNSADAVMVRTAVAAGLGAHDPLLRGAALAAAFGAEDTSLRALAAASALAEREGLSLRQENGEAMLTLSSLTFDSGSGRLSAIIGGDGDFSRCNNEEIAGTLVEPGIDLAGARCTLELRLGADGALAGTFVAVNRYRHAVSGSLR